MKPLAQDDEQVSFWWRHTRLGVALCVVLPAVVAVRTLTVESVSNAGLVLAIGAAVAFLSPLLLMLPIERMVRHRWGRLFFDGWEAFGIVVVSAFALLDGGADSPYITFFFILLAHAALAYPPAGMLLAGSCNILGYFVVWAVAGGVPGQDALAVVLALAVATGTCAFASYNHVLAYERTAAYARQVTALAARDGLTGCLNHRAFHERAAAEASTAGGAHPLALLIVDVDDFKAVNDTYGHAVGDEVLRLIGRGLNELCRSNDVAGRLGGDEFALLLPCTTAQDAMVVGERLCTEVRQQGAAYGVTVSVGVAVTTTRSETSGLLAAADKAVYRAKRAGRDRVDGADCLLLVR